MSTEYQRLQQQYASEIRSDAPDWKRAEELSKELDRLRFERDSAPAPDPLQEKIAHVNHDLLAALSPTAEFTVPQLRLTEGKLEAFSLVDGERLFEQSVRAVLKTILDYGQDAYTAALGVLPDLAPEDLSLVFYAEKDGALRAIALYCNGRLYL